MAPCPSLLKLTPCLNFILEPSHVKVGAHPPSRFSRAFATNKSTVGGRFITKRFNFDFECKKNYPFVVKASASDDQTKTEPWKRELGNMPTNFDDFDEEALREDIEKLNKKRAFEKLKSSNYNQSKNDEEQSSFNLREWVDKLLVADFFFVLFALAWLVVGVAFKWGGDDARVIDSWLFLWNPVFQPAIGILMAGAIFSAVGKKEK